MDSVKRQRCTSEKRRCVRKISSELRSQKSGNSLKIISFLVHWWPNQSSVSLWWTGRFFFLNKKKRSKSTLTSNHTQLMDEEETLPSVLLLLLLEDFPAAGCNFSVTTTTKTHRDLGHIHHQPAVSCFCCRIRRERGGVRECWLVGWFVESSHRTTLVYGHGGFAAACLCVCVSVEVVRVNGSQQHIT